MSGGMRMKQEKVIKLQILMICMSIVGFESALLLWKPTWITIALLIGLNGFVASLILELLPFRENDSSTNTKS